MKKFSVKLLFVILCLGLAPACLAQTIVQTAAQTPDVSTLVELLNEAGLVATLESEGPFTVFCPVNEAFVGLGEAEIMKLKQPKNKKKLVAVLKYHVVPGLVKSEKVPQLSYLKTAQGSNLSISVEAGEVKINKAKLVKADIICSNGVIHLIDKVMIPEDPREAGQEGGLQKRDPRGAGGKSKKHAGAGSSN